MDLIDEMGKMAMTRRKRRERDDASRQAEQARMVEEARQIPGVAEATDVYEMLHGRVGPMVASVPVVRYATSTNH